MEDGVGSTSLHESRGIMDVGVITAVATIESQGSEGEAPNSEKLVLRLAR